MPAAIPRIVIKKMLNALSPLGPSIGMSSYSDLNTESGSWVKSSIPSDSESENPIQL
jgi:hypothetical protein